MPRAIVKSAVNALTELFANGLQGAGDATQEMEWKAIINFTQAGWGVQKMGLHPSQGRMPRIYVSIGLLAQSAKVARQDARAGIFGLAVEWACQ